MTDTTTIDIERVRKDVVETLEAFGFGMVDADPTDLRHPTYPVRFKIGTSRGEVAISVYYGQSTAEVIRIISDRTWTEGIQRMVDLIRRES